MLSMQLYVSKFEKVLLSLRILIYNFKNYTYFLCNNKIIQTKYLSFYVLTESHNHHHEI